MMKNCLITCATSEIGQAVSKALSNQCENFYLFARNDEKLSTLYETLDSTSQTCIHTHHLDFNDRASIEASVASIKGGLDSVVFLLPKIPASDTTQLPDEEWEKLFRLVFVRPLLFLESLIPLLKKAERAKVVLVSGISSRQYLGNYSINGPLRAAWVAQMKAMSQEYGKDGIHFNTLSLGGVLTPSFMQKVEKEVSHTEESIESALARRYHNVPLNKYASMDDVCRSIEGMLSPATDHMTGQNIMCDGGFIRCY